MHHALTIASRGGSYLLPNPMVGAVLVTKNMIIGEGWHCGPGTAHAEIMAIEQACHGGHPTEGATLYTTLEPCCHLDKRTPPCTQSIIAHKITRVVIGLIDPNPSVYGKGMQILQSAGIDTELLPDISDIPYKIIVQNEIYIRYIQSDMPFVHLKIAQSIDGHIATDTGESKWITNETARQEAHRLRSIHSAVMVGGNTARIDNPRLTVRAIRDITRQPARVVVDTNLQLLQQERPLNLFAPSTIVWHRPPNASDEISGRSLQELRQCAKNHGMRLCEAKTDASGGLNLKEVLRGCRRLELFSILVEGGSRLITSFLRKKLWDKITIFIAPILIGKSPYSIGDLGIKQIADALKLHHICWNIVDQQVILTGYRDIEATFGKVAPLFGRNGAAQ